MFKNTQGISHIKIFKRYIVILKCICMCYIYDKFTLKLITKIDDVMDIFLFKKINKLVLEVVIDDVYVLYDATNW